MASFPISGMCVWVISALYPSFFVLSSGMLPSASHSEAIPCLASSLFARQNAIVSNLNPLWSAISLAISELLRVNLHRYASE